MKTKIEETSIVNHIIRAMPKALRVFRRHGIDSCCGGELTVQEAARKAGIDPYRLVSELRKEGGGKIAAA